MTMMMMNLQK